MYLFLRSENVSRGTEYWRNDYFAGGRNDGWSGKRIVFSRSLNHVVDFISDFDH